MPIEAGKLFRLFRLLNLTVFLLIVFACDQKKPVEKFATYEQVENYLERSSFAIDETTDTSESSFITFANFKSRDGDTGFLTLRFRGKKYVFSDVPVDVWERFKSAESKGKFYHRHIKDRYHLRLSR